MSDLKREKITRIGLALAILLLGAALIPFVDIPVEAITWKTLAGVYEPDLVVNENSGAPGSVFAFTGSDFPPLSNASVYVNGSLLGSVMTDGSGMATFKLATAGAPVGQYNVTLEVNVNASATESIELKSGDSIVTPPLGFPGPEFSLQNQIYLPAIFAD